MKRLILTLVLTFTSFGILSGFTPRVQAFDAFQDACDSSSGATNSSVCQDNASNRGASLLSGQGSIVATIANLIALVGGVIAVVFMMINGLAIITSTGDSGKISKARDGIIYSAVGIVVIVMARTIVALIMRFL